MGKRTKDLENNEELVSGNSKIKKVALYVLGIILGLIFLSPFYILFFFKSLFKLCRVNVRLKFKRFLALF